MSFFPEYVQKFLAPDPPETTQSGSAETTQSDPPGTTKSAFNVISLNDLKAHHRGAGPKFTADSIIKAIYGEGPQFSNASEGTHARQEHGHSNAQESYKGLQLESNTSVRTVHGDSSGPALYPGSQLYEHIIGIKESESGSVKEQQTYYDNVIKFIGASVVSSTGPDPTNVVAILFGESQGANPLQCLWPDYPTMREMSFGPTPVLPMDNLEKTIQLPMLMINSPRFLYHLPISQRLPTLSGISSMFSTNHLSLLCYLCLSRLLTVPLLDRRPHRSQNPLHVPTGQWQNEAQHATFRIQVRDYRVWGNVSRFTNLCILLVSL
jgi:hypothetical protein